MSIPKSEHHTDSHLAPVEKLPSQLSQTSSPQLGFLATCKRWNPLQARRIPDGAVATFANRWAVAATGWGVFGLVVIANVYAIVQLGLGHA